MLTHVRTLHNALAINDTAVYPVGHSTHSISDFLALLARPATAAIADVRSSPYRRMNPQFSRESLKAALREWGGLVNGMKGPIEMAFACTIKTRMTH